MKIRRKNEKIGIWNLLRNIFNYAFNEEEMSINFHSHETHTGRQWLKVRLMFPYRVLNVLRLRTESSIS